MSFHKQYDVLLERGVFVFLGADSDPTSIFLIRTETSHEDSASIDYT